jgi:hypothetical protein
MFAVRLLFSALQRHANCEAGGGAPLLKAKEEEVIAVRCDHAAQQSCDGRWELFGWGFAGTLATLGVTRTTRMGQPP